MRLKFRPVDSSFYDLFSEAANHLVVGAQLLSEMLADGSSKAEIAQRMREAEHAADETTHSIIRRVNSTFVSPFDREDIYALASALDDVVDFTEEAADFMGLYNIEAPMEQAQQQARVLEDCCRNIAQALSRLRGFQDLNHYFVEVNRLENEGDRITREALASLFRGGIDPMVVIRWKDIFERLEHAIDSCEHVANILEGIVVKHT